MYRQIIYSVVIAALPMVVFVGGGWVMLQVSGRDLSGVEEEHRKPLGKRLSYDIDAAAEHWGALSKKGLLRAEQTFLQLDLVFPVLLGAALAFGLVLAWDILGRPFNPAWILVPVLLAVLFDWTENLVQLNQITRFSNGGKEALSESWIWVASNATLLKTFFFGGAFVALVVLLVLGLVRGAKSS